MNLGSLALGYVSRNVDYAMRFAIRLPIDHMPITRKPTNLTIWFNYAVLGREEFCVSVTAWYPPSKCRSSGYIAYKTHPIGRRLGPNHRVDQFRRVTFLRASKSGSL